MPLILCPNCSREVSADAVACPECARPLKTNAAPDAARTEFLVQDMLASEGRSAAIRLCRKLHPEMTPDAAEEYVGRLPADLPVVVARENQDRFYGGFVLAAFVVVLLFTMYKLGSTAP